MPNLIKALTSALCESTENTFKLSWKDILLQVANWSVRMLSIISIITLISSFFTWSYSMAVSLKGVRLEFMVSRTLDNIHTMQVMTQ